MDMAIGQLDIGQIVFSRLGGDILPYIQYNLIRYFNNNISRKTETPTYAKCPLSFAFCL